MMPTPEATPMTDAAIHKYWNGGQWSPEFAQYTRSLERRLSRVAGVWEEAREELETEASFASTDRREAALRELVARIDAELAALKEGKHGTE